MRRREFLTLIPTAAGAQNGMRDRYFARYPFDKWTESGEQSQIHWTVHVPNAQLSSHQRLAGSVEVEIDPREVEKRRGRGELITFLQIQDSEGHRWRRHETFSLATMNLKAKAVIYVQEFFVTPGDYKVAVAVCDSHTSEYSFAHRTLRVSPLHNDPLPNVFANLPSLEFVPRLGFPDSWYQPYVRGRLNLPVETSKPVRIEVMLNLSLSERAAGSLAAFRRNMSVLLPALKVLSQIRPSDGVVNVTLFDLTKRRIWEQKEIRDLNWERLRGPFAETTPGVIDAQSLAAKEQMTQFFWDQVLKRLDSDPDKSEWRVVIILGSPIFLGHQIKVEPAVVPKDPQRKVFYLRYRPLPRRPPVLPQMPDALAVTQAAALPNDDLERTLKALDARNFNLLTPAEFRRALSNIMDSIRTWIE